MTAQQLAFRAYGTEGPPLIILHGLFGSARNWHTLAQKLAERYRVWAVDLRNHGQSFWSPQMEYEVLAADVAALMDAQELAHAMVMGHSMGGKTAMVLALQQPERVDKLVVLDIAPISYGSRFEDYIQAMQNLDLGVVNQRTVADQWLSQFIPEAGIRAFLLQNLVVKDGRFDWRINLSALSTQLPHILDFPTTALGQRQYDGPTLFVAGELSNYIGPNDHDTIKGYFPNALIDTLPQAGHWLHADQPTALLNRLHQFLA